jgi:hypothetical protein
MAQQRERIFKRGISRTGIGIVVQPNGGSYEKGTVECRNCLLRDLRIVLRVQTAGQQRAAADPFFALAVRALCARFSPAAERRVGHLIYCPNEDRIQRQDLVLEGPRPLVLRDRSRQAEPRPESDIRIRDLWLGRDSGSGAHRQNRVEDFLVSQRRPLPCAHQSECPKSGKSFRSLGRWHRRV